MSLSLAVASLRLGLRLRRARLSRRPPPRGTRASHLRVAKPAVLCIGLGMLAGPASAVWLRGWQPIHSLHGVLGVLATGLFVATAWFGRRLESGDRSAHVAHAWLAALAVLAGAVTAVAGFVLLP